nr:TANK-binding kinase 1-binding protein 1-like [Aegilops tauschii subsp. strangulata]
MAKLQEDLLGADPRLVAGRLELASGWLHSDSAVRALLSQAAAASEKEKHAAARAAANRKAALKDGEAARVRCRKLEGELKSLRDERAKETRDRKAEEEEMKAREDDIKGRDAELGELTKAQAAERSRLEELEQKSHPLVVAVCHHRRPKAPPSPTTVAARIALRLASPTSSPPSLDCLPVNIVVSVLLPKSLPPHRCPVPYKPPCEALPFLLLCRAPTAPTVAPLRPRPRLARSGPTLTAVGPRLGHALHRPAVSVVPRPLPPRGRGHLPVRAHRGRASHAPHPVCAHRGRLPCSAAASLARAPAPSARWPQCRSGAQSGSAR